jgi:hypothetical protein
MPARALISTSHAPSLWRTHSIENTFYGKHILSI